MTHPSDLPRLPRALRRRPIADSPAVAALPAIRTLLERPVASPDDLSRDTLRALRADIATGPSFSVLRATVLASRFHPDLLAGVGEHLMALICADSDRLSSTAARMLAFLARKGRLSPEHPALLALRALAFALPHTGMLPAAPGGPLLQRRLDAMRALLPLALLTELDLCQLWKDFAASFSYDDMLRLVQHSSAGRLLWSRVLPGPQDDSTSLRALLFAPRAVRDPVINAELWNIVTGRRRGGLRTFNGMSWPSPGSHVAVGSLVIALLATKTPPASRRRELLRLLTDHPADALKVLNDLRTLDPDVIPSFTEQEIAALLLSANAETRAFAFSLVPSAAPARAQTVPAAAAPQSPVTDSPPRSSPRR